MNATAERHLAQFNVGRLTHPVDAPEVAEFVDALARVNEIAERTPGFEWRLKDETSGGAIDIRPDPEDAQQAVNLSVWSSVEAFESFVWRTVHARFYRRRGEWFETHETPHFVMWWVAPGHRPSLEAAMARLEDLRANGPSERAFGWESLPKARLWREARCA